MRGGKFSSALPMQCATCGGTAFGYEAETGPVKCMGCDRTFEKEELMRENGEVIDSGVAELAPDLVKYARDELRKSLRKTVSDSKRFKLK